MLVPVLLSGGVGSRLWPLSRESFPKQFQDLTSDLSMLQETAARVDGLDNVADPLVVCNEEHRFLVAEQFRNEKRRAAAIILEPEGKNTAPAVALAALRAVQTDPEAVLLVLPADHVIQQVEAFCEAVGRGLPFAQKGQLVTFGIVPTSPETGYGYLKRGDELAESTFTLAQFVEKPNRATAEAYLDSGEYCWNSGMFLFSARAYLEELGKYQPAMLKACEQAMASTQTDIDFLRVDAKAFAACPADSIDYAVMEHTDRAVMVALDCGWSDVGSWSALWDVADKDEQNNYLHGDVLVEDVKNSYLRSQDRLLAAVGVDNLVIVETPDAVMVADKNRVQDVKAIVSKLKADGRDEAKFQHRVYRPWGSYESLVVGDLFQVKRIIVKPGERLSLQMHHHRAEHWIVVKGTAEVVRGEETMILSEDQSTYIPLGTKHRLSNPGVIPLELIEVQTGSYLGEDDIVRFEDVYGRSQ
ncbi:mannose-1-phosphate guanylyltransferase/mannose-6-phosphate isomerase [Litorivivens lipolytica]|uniref:mannose-1-phosphate guanylyltransferase n=1 Tax=Litorivivens lipolytica TaxID=1524264 RepID=A0A7W4Z6Z3_9GAMM|nr:mannose-1-phosphate guanylyltransferase/mannose-6-phosphate isomerase [Litorivivens lipolytica]MBB3047480.1 mannose-1-phosphate guanylyltransferase/mannose-6-phosphate isomerase [Litorivivens lipolytica]